MATTKKVVAAPSRGVNKGKTCSAKGCTKDAYCKGLCAPHYSQERRKDPVEREKAREASKRSYAKRRAAQEGVTHVEVDGTVVAKTRRVTAKKVAK